MTNIILATLNARYIHASLGLRYLRANMKELEQYTSIREFVISSRPIDVAEKLLSESPDIIGLGVYIWNVIEVTALVKLIKTISPDTTIVLGGPEVSFETEQQDIFASADYIITGMADLAFHDLCHQLINNESPENKVIKAAQPPMDAIQLPYDQFTEEDVANRVIYVEASRGCPFKCEFCLSSLDKTAWPFDIDNFLESMQRLYDKGVRHYKFVDRTFNLKIDASIRILDFFLDKQDETLFLHFELIPDHLPEKLKTAIKRFPDGALQFEIGIQTFNPDVQSLISRKQDNQKSLDNIRWLREETTAHLHTDLIVGLPSEDMDSFAHGFDQLMALNPGEIQVGILKRLRGTPIMRHTIGHGMRYNPEPPYNILATDKVDFPQMQRLARFARYWDMVANSGRFKNILPIFLGDQPFNHFMQFSDWLFSTTDKTHKISLKRLFNHVHKFLIDVLELPEADVMPMIMMDYSRLNFRGVPEFAQTEDYLAKKNQPRKTSRADKRQVRHVG